MKRISGWKKSLLVVLGCSLWHLPLGACAALSLDQAVDMALNQNTEIRIAAKGEDKAEAELAAAKGADGVTVTATSSVSISDGAEKKFSNSNTNTLKAALPIYTGGKNELTIENTKSAYLSSQFNTMRTKENIKLSTIKAYYDVLEAQKTIAVDKESVDNYAAHLENVEQLYSAGSKAKIEVLRSEVQLSDARQTLIKAQNTYEIALSTLKNIIRLDREEPLELTTDFSYMTFSPELSECLAKARENRKDLRQAELAVEESEKDIKIAKAGFLPSVDLTASVGWEDRALPDDKHYNYTAGVTANWDIFDNQVTKANVKGAEAARDEAELTLLKKTDDIDLEVRQAYLNMREAEKRFISTGDAVKQAREDYYIANAKYKAGEGLMLDIIDAQLALSTAQLNYISAQYDYVRYKAEVENVIGSSEEVAQ